MIFDVKVYQTGVTEESWYQTDTEVLLKFPHIYSYLLFELECEDVTKSLEIYVLGNKIILEWTLGLIHLDYLCP